MYLYTVRITRRENVYSQRPDVQDYESLLCKAQGRTTVLTKDEDYLIWNRKGEKDVFGLRRS